MTPRVKGAVLIGVALVAAAILIRSQSPARTPSSVSPVVAAPTFVTESPLRERIPVTDSNNDGVPDWQELLNNTKPLALPVATTTFTPPETLTDQFALEFFETYVRNEGFGAFGREPQEIINEASEELIAQVQDTLYTERDITIQNGVDVRSYVNAVADTILTHTVPPGTPSELTIIEQAVATNSSEPLQQLRPIIVAYDGIIKSMEQTTVPSTMVKEHLNLLNAVLAVRNDIIAMQELFADPIVALLRLQRYQDDLLGLSNTLSDIYLSASRRGVVFDRTDTAAQVFNVSP